MLKSASARRLARINVRRAFAAHYTVDAFVIRRNGTTAQGLTGPAALKHLARVRGTPHAVWCY